ncbi:acetylxylan esterase [Planctomycetota bacterium]
MANVDMSLAELKEYRGTNPCPKDFESYWERGLAEMRAQDPAVEMKRACFQSDFADCFDLTFTGVGGARIYAKLLKPKRLTRPCPGLLEFHGYSVHSGDWFNKLPYVAQGFMVASMDCRGQGGKSEDLGGIQGNTLHGHVLRGLDDAPDKLLYRQIFLDTAQLARILMAMDEVDETRIGATGGSQGGGLSVACAALEPRVQRIVSIFPFLSDYQRCWDLDLETGPYDELKAYFRRFDPRHEREAAVFERLGYIDIHHLARRVQARVLMGLTLRDDICPPSTQFAVYNNLPADKQMLLYPDFGHENLPEFADRTFSFLSELS